MLIGLTIVAISTSTPELMVSLVAALRDQPDIAVGNAIGSNTANIGMVLGIVALLRPIELRSATLRHEMPALLAVHLLTVGLCLDSHLSRVDGLVLLASMVMVFFWLTKLGMRSSSSDPMQAEFDAEIPKNMSMRVAMLWLLIGIGTLLLGAELLVDGAVEIAKALGVSEIVIGMTIVAVATSLPELAVSVVGAFRGEYAIAIGNIVGSNIFNLVGVLGLAVAVQPAALPPSVMSLHIFVMVAFTLVLFAMTYEYEGRGRITRFEGFALIGAYAAYLAYAYA
jgi:cation:H+ antiporter